MFSELPELTKGELPQCFGVKRSVLKRSKQRLRHPVINTEQSSLVVSYPQGWDSILFYLFFILFFILRILSYCYKTKKNAKG